MSSLIPALGLAARGLRVFPVSLTEKKPAVTGWQQAASSDLGALLAMFDGKRRNVGVYTTRLIVLDADVRKGGLETLLKLGDLPRTFTVRTPSGGKHLYYRAPDGWAASSDVNVWPGIDVRAEGGLVVGPGSVFGGKPYTVETDAEIVEAPAHIVAALKQHALKPKNKAVLAEDMPGAVENATRYLQTMAPSGEEGARNQTAFIVAARCIDFGCTAATAASLMAEYWDCEPPLDDGELEDVCGRAMVSRNDPPGIDNASLGLTPVANVSGEMAKKDVDERIKRFALTDDDIAALKPRPWIVPRRLVRQKVTMLIADAGVGKTTLALQWACAVAEGGDAAKRLAVDVRETVPVLVLNGEDEEDELNRRLAAVAKRFGCDLKELRGKLHLTSGSAHPWTFIVRGGQRDTLVETPAVDALIDYIKRHGIGVLIVDPLVEMHEADENKNPEMKRVMGVFRRIAEQCNCAVLVVHHSRKPSGASSEGSAGNLSSSRGASAVGGVARVAYTLYSMSDADGERYGVPTAQRHRYVRLDDAKSNLGLASPKAIWFLREGYALPCGEEIGVLVPTTIDDKRDESARIVLDVLCAKVTAGETIALSEIAARMVDDPMCGGMTAAQLGKRLLELFAHVGDKHTAHGVSVEMQRVGRGGLIRVV